jgi:hypothetical protein
MGFLTQILAFVFIECSYLRFHTTFDQGPKVRLFARHNAQATSFITTCAYVLSHGMEPMHFHTTCTDIISHGPGRRPFHTASPLPLTRPRPTSFHTVWNPTHFHTTCNDVLSHELERRPFTRPGTTSFHTTCSDVLSHDLQRRPFTRPAATSFHTTWNDVLSHDLERRPFTQHGTHAISPNRVHLQHQVLFSTVTKCGEHCGEQKSSTFGPRTK